MISVQKLAHDYASSSTNTRCAYMGVCKDCKNISCDYRARYLSFIEGFKTAIKKSEE